MALAEGWGGGGLWLSDQRSKKNKRRAGRQAGRSVRSRTHRRRCTARRCRFHFHVSLTVSPTHLNRPRVCFVLPSAHLSRRRRSPVDCAEILKTGRPTCSLPWYGSTTAPVPASTVISEALARRRRIATRRFKLECSSTPENSPASRIRIQNFSCGQLEDSESSSISGGDHREIDAHGGGTTRFSRPDRRFY